VVNKSLIERQFHNKMLWTRFGMIVLGLWLLTSPETFGYKQVGLKYSDFISGLLLIFFGFVSMSFPFRGWVWGGCLVGVWLQMAPLLFWAEQPVAYLNDTLIGVLAIAFCVLVPLRPTEFEIGPQIPPGWTYNPSSWQQRVPVIFFAMVGWFVARYLSAYQLHYIDKVWPYGDGTTKVLTSMIAQNFPVPDAGLGALAYSLEAIMGAKGGVRRWHTMPWLVIMFGILVIPLGFVSIVLVTLQPLVVGAWCVLCLIIAACMLVMLSLTVDEMVCVCQYIRHEMRSTGRKFWHVVLKGSNYEKDEVDTRTPSVHSSPGAFIKTMVLGVTLPWNLIITAALGAWLLFADQILGFSGILAKNGNVMGALTTVFSIVAWAEVARALRLINILLMAWLIVAALVLPGATLLVLVHSVVVGGLVIVLSLFKGRAIQERYGTWQKMIF